MLAHLIRLPVLPLEIVEPNVEVFRTGIRTARQANVVLTFVRAYFPGLHVTLDLDDHDRVLRIEGAPGERLPVVGVRRLVTALGFEIEVLPD